MNGVTICDLSLNPNYITTPTRGRLIQDPNPQHNSSPNSYPGPNPNPNPKGRRPSHMESIDGHCPRSCNLASVQAVRFRARVWVRAKNAEGMRACYGLTFTFILFLTLSFTTLTLILF